MSLKRNIIGIFTGFLSFLWHERTEHKRPGKGPGEIERPKSKEAEPMPVVFGTVDVLEPCVAYFAVDSIDKINSSRESGYKYSVGMHLVFCTGNADKIIRARVDEKTAYLTNVGSSTDTDIVINVDKPDMFGGSTKEGGVVGKLRFQQGLPDQQPNTYMANSIYDQEVDTAPLPAWRGISAIILEGVYIGNSPYLKKWDFRIQRIHMTDFGAEQWYDAKAEIQSVEEPTVVAYDDDFTIWRLRMSATPEVGDAPFGYGTPTGATYSINTFLVNPESLHYYRRLFDMDARHDFVVAGECYTSCRVYLIPGEYEGGEFPLMFNETQISQYKVYDSSTDEDITEYEFFSFSFPLSQDNYSNEEYSLFCAVDGRKVFTSDPVYFYATIEKRLDYDMNPAHVIRECLTSQDWGRGYSSSDIGSTSFEAAADTLYAEKMGFSYLWDRKNDTIDDFIQMVLDHIDGKLRVNRTTGQWELKLIRDDCDEIFLDLFDDTNSGKVTNYKKTILGDLVNSVAVSYRNLDSKSSGSIIVKDESLMHTQNAVIQQSIEYMGFTNADVATRAGRRELSLLSSPLASFTLEADRTAGSLNIGDAFVVEKPRYNIDNLVVRVNGINYGNTKSKKVTIDCVQDVFDLPDKTVTIDDIVEGKPTTEVPATIDQDVYMEIPYFILRDIKGDASLDYIMDANRDSGFLAAAAGKPSNTAVLAEMWVSNSGGDYAYKEDITFSPSATLSSDITILQTSFNVVNRRNLQYVEVGELCSIGYEFMQVVSIDNDTGDIVVKRGMLDTLVQTHNAPSYILFWDNYLSDDSRTYTSTINLDTKLLNRTSTQVQQLSEVLSTEVRMRSRAYRPIIPGNLQINGEYFPDEIEGLLTVSWAHRNRLSTTETGFIDGSVTSEAGVTYNLRIYGETGTLIKEETGLTGTSYEFVDQTTDEASMTIELESERDGYTSYYYYIVGFDISGAGYGMDYGYSYGSV